MDGTVIRVQNLTKSFGGRKVVDELSFSVKRGEVFALLGRNGAGKSTTIDLILGLKTPDGGAAALLEQNAAKNRKQVFERVGVQLQHTQYQSNITVEEACIEYASLYALPADYPVLLEKFGLLPLRKSLVSKLSGGERQKLSVVLALIGKPEIVFLDELTTGLDVAARREVWRTLKQLNVFPANDTLFYTISFHLQIEKIKTNMSADSLCDRPRSVLFSRGEKPSQYPSLWSSFSTSAAFRTLPMETTCSLTTMAGMLITP